MVKHAKDFLLSHKGNSYRPNILERFSIGVMLILVLISFGVANIQALLWIGSDWLVSTVLPSVIVDLTNDERDGKSLVPLTRSAVLDAAAKLKAEDMAKHGYFSHYSPSGVSPWFWFDQVGYDYLHAGENLAVHFTESNQVVEAWMDSPTHRANIMNGQYVEIGVGTAKGEFDGSPTVFVVQLFGVPRETVVVDTPEMSIEKLVVAETVGNVAPATIVTSKAILGQEAEKDSESLLQHKPTMDTEQSVSELVLKESSSSNADEAISSREGDPKIPATPDTNNGNSVSIPVRSATQPSMWLMSLYSVLAVLVVGSLTLSIAIEWRRHHPVQIAYAGGLLAVMGLLLYMHEMLTGHVLIA